MMKLFRRYILGGLSDKTEGTLFAFLIGVAWATWAIWETATGTDMSAAWPFLTAYGMATVAAFTGATVVGHLKPTQSATGLREAGQIAPPVGEWAPEGEGAPVAPPVARGPD